PWWAAIFTKAFALVAAEFPELRRAYCKFPWPHLYEYPTSVATIMMEREYRGEQAVFGLLVKDPARRAVAQLSRSLNAARTAEVAEVDDFRRALWVAGLPRPLRRLLWGGGVDGGRQRANYFAAFGAESLHPLSPLTCTLNYGVIAPDGTVDVRLIYDHRVTDGPTIARAMVRLERVLNTSLCGELTSLPSATAA